MYSSQANRLFPVRGKQTPMRTPKATRHQNRLQTFHDDKSLLYYIKVLCPERSSLSLLRRHTISSEFMPPLSIFSTHNSNCRGRPRGGFPLWLLVCAMFIMAETFHTESFLLYSRFFCTNRAATCLRCWYVPPTVQSSLGRFISRPQTVVFNGCSSCSRGARRFG